MSTYWLSTAGTDTASGTTFGLAMKTLWGLKASLGQGDIVNVVNDGVHAATATPVWFNTVYNGTNYDTNPGIVIRGTDSSGDKAIATIAMTASKKEWASMDDLADYWWVEGLRFDYSALANIPTADMEPIIITGNPWNCRLNDCEIMLSTTLGAGVDLDGNTELPRFPAFSGASVTHTGTMEIYYNVLLNSQLYRLNSGGMTWDCHHNLIIHDAADPPETWAPRGGSTGDAASPRRFYNNTMVVIAYGTDKPATGFIDNGANDTTNLAFHSNLFFIETGSNAATAITNYLIEGDPLVAAQTTGVITCSHNYIALGTLVTAESTSWDASTNLGVYEGQYNSAWRAGGTNGGTAINANDVLDRTGTITGIFSAPTSAFTWTPGDYSHDLPGDYRPIVGRTAALDGGVVGAIDAVVNQGPTCSPFTITATAGVLKTVNVTDGLAAHTSDPEGDPLEWAVSLPASHGTVVLNTTFGNFTYTPNITYTGTDTFRFDAWDGTTFSTNESTVTINISNQTPTVSPRSYSTPESVTLSITAGAGMLAGAADADPGQTLSVTSVVAPAIGTLVSYNITTGSFVYRPGPFAAGLDSFTFKVTDGNTLTAATTAAIMVIAVADAVATDIIDTAPFFRPTLKVETEIRARWKKNRQKALNEANYTDGHDWNESTSRSLVLTPAETKLITLGGVASAQYLFVETDYPIEVSIDGTDKYWPVSKALAVALTDYSSVWLKSVSATNAQVIMTVVD